MPYKLPSFEIQALIKTVVDSIKTVVDSNKTTTDTVLQKIQNGDLKRNIVIFDNPGTYTWKCPEGVSVVYLIMFGAGGAGQSVTDQYTYTSEIRGGNGGAYVHYKLVKVTPGTNYSIVVGKGADGRLPVGTNLEQGPAGGSSSAFGITCLGGPATTVSIPPQTHRLVTPGAATPPINVNYVTDFDRYRTPYGNYGQTQYVNSKNLGGGAGGFGNGGVGKSSASATVVGPGAGSGASLNYAADTGGHGIVIIEY